MAKKTKNKSVSESPPPPAVDEDERDEEEASSDEAEDKEAAEASDDEADEASESSSAGDEGDAEGEGESAAIVKADAGASIEAAGEDAAARTTEGAAEEDEEEVVAGQLGVDRYVLAGFFAAGMLATYVLGRLIQGVWSNFAEKTWFNTTFPRLAGVEDKNSLSLVVGGIAAIVLVIKTYKRPDVRAWTDDVANELAKCRWPTRKEVSNSTIVVIAASAAATLYLALLDRLWAFVTSLVYGDGSG